MPSSVTGIRPPYNATSQYELQLAKAAQRRGLGRRLTQLLELVALRNGLPKVVLTCFVKNEAAVNSLFSRANRNYSKAHKTVC